nr:UDP-N-acetyl-D-mannosamine dehydrogenase [Actinomyces sp. UMB0138]
MCEQGSLAVIGLGYIGLPTAVVLAQNGWKVTGVDVSDRTLEFVNAGKLPFVEEGLESALKEVVDSGALVAQKETPASDVYIISVPTPFKGDHEADLSYIDAAIDKIIPQLQGDELVVLESTSPPLTTERMAERVFAARPDLKREGEGHVMFAHAPERVLPGRIMIEMTANDRIIGGLTPEATQRAKEVYDTFCAGHVHTTDAKTAELAKLVENSFRDVNIAFANELSLIAQDLGIDVWELIELANKHPRVNILRPGPGVGGHCIAVDPWFIVSADRKNSRLINTARQVNDAKPKWVLGQVRAALEGKQAPKVAILGLAFKPNIDDLRESPALRIARELVEGGNGQFDIYEPSISQLPDALCKEGATLKDTANPGKGYDLALVLVGHDQFTPDFLSGLQAEQTFNYIGK